MKQQAKARRGCGCGTAGGCGCRGAKVPASAHDILRTEGRPLDGDVRAAMEPRFRHDFSRVRVHSGGAAAESAREVGARAYTVGHHIVLGGEVDRHLLAHELAHVVQQGSGIRAASVSAPRDASEREADAAARSAIAGTAMPVIRRAPLHVARIPIAPPTHGPAPRVPVVTPGPPARGALEIDPTRPVARRGPNPADCLRAICPPLATTPLNRHATSAAVTRWRDASLACIRGGAAASGASHAAAIVANDVAEITSDAADIVANLRSPGDQRDAVVRACPLKQREVELEFRYNVIFETGFVNSLPEWDLVDEALRAIPDDSLWGSPVTVTFRSGSLGRALGQTSASRGQTAASITMDPSAITPVTSGQYVPLQLPVGVATLRHEVAHVVQDHTPRAVLNELFETLLEWRNWTLRNVHATPPGHPEWAVQRAEARARAGGSEADFDAFLATIDTAQAALGTRGLSTPPVERGGFDWVAGTGGTPLLVTYRAGTVSRGPEFVYARSNQGDFFSEVYTFATSRPEWLHDQLPPDQIIWWKRHIFHLPIDRAEWARQLATSRPIPPDFFANVERLFTWPQVRPFVDAIVAAPAAGEAAA